MGFAATTRSGNHPNNDIVAPMSWWWRLLAGGALPARWFERGLPPVDARAARTGRLSLEVVSHCWNYAHLLVYQLSSLVLNPPRELDVTMTVFHAVEDERTVRLLEFF